MHVQGFPNISQAVDISQQKQIDVSPKKTVKACLSKAEEIFLSTELKSQASKNAIQAELSVAYREILSLQKEGALLAGGTSGLNERMTRLFYLFGRCLYGKNMDGTRKCLELSLAIRLVGEEVLAHMPKLPDNELVDLPKSLQEEELKEIDDWLMNSQQEDVVKAACQKGGKASMEFASTLRWLGHAFQNIDKYINASELSRFEKIYNAARAILETIQDKDSSWEIGQLLYNTTRFIHKLKDRNDIEGALKTLDQVLPYLEKEGNSLRAKVLEAQINNIQAIESDKIQVDSLEKRRQILEIQYSKVQQAVDIANGLEGFDPFLKDMFINNLIGFGVKCLKEELPKITVEKMSNLKETVINYIEKEQGNHYYFSHFYINLAKFEIYREDSLEAIRMLSLGLETVLKTPESSDASAKKIVEMLSKIMEEAPSDEKEEVYKLAFSSIDMAVKIISGAEKFDPFLKTLLINSRLECGYKCLMAGYEVVTVEELEELKKILLNNIRQQGYNNDYFALMMLNLAKYELFRENPREAMERLKETLTITMKFAKTETSQAAAQEVKQLIPTVMAAINARLNKM